MLENDRLVHILDFRGYDTVTNKSSQVSTFIKLLPTLDICHLDTSSDVKINCKIMLLDDEKITRKTFSPFWQ